MALVVELVGHLAGQFGLPGSEFESRAADPATAPVAANLSRPRSDIRACSNSAIEPRVLKNIRPMAVRD